MSQMCMLHTLRVNFEKSQRECQALQAERDKLVQENGRLAQSDAARELQVQALSQDVEKREVTNDGSLLWDSLTLHKHHNGKAGQS
jgi:hypothetical protein